MDRFDGTWGSESGLVRAPMLVDVIECLTFFQRTPTEALTAEHQRVIEQASAGPGRVDSNTFRPIRGPQRSYWANRSSR